jgi:antitoxin ParD1/3/4
MRTNIDIDDAILEAAMKAGPFKTKKDAVEAGLKLLARQAAYREILKWEGKLHWDGDKEDDTSSVVGTGDTRSARAVVANQPRTKALTPGKKTSAKTGHGRR